jgi:HEPN domain-containing protein
MHRLLIPAVAMAALTVAACSSDQQDSVGPDVTELELATASAADAEAVSAATGTDTERWFHRLFQRLRETDDPEAQACLREARELRMQAHEAYEAGDLEEARRLAREAFRKMLCAVVEVFPNAPQRTGEAVDQVVARIYERVGDREAPRIRRVLAHVEELRTNANAALEAGDSVTALEFNLRAMHLLRRLVDYMHHVRHRDDHDRATDELGLMGSG